MGPERRRVEESKSASLPDFGKIVERIGEYAIFLVTTENEIVSWNKGVEEVFGYPREEFEGKEGTILFVPEDIEKNAPERELRTAAREGRAADNRWHLCQDGTRIWVNGVMLALYDEEGEVSCFVKVVRDNTREKEAEDALRKARDELERRVEERTGELRDTVEELRRSEKLFAAIFRAGPFAAVVVDDDERIRDINRAFERLTGYEEREVVGEPTRVITENEWPKDLWDGHEPGEVFHDQELHLRTRDGETRVVLASGVKLPIDGRTGRLVMFFDITERKRTEDELMQAIQDVMQDASWFSRSVVERLAEIRSGSVDTSRVNELTRRERQVLEQVAKGLSNAQIAELLGIAPQTVRNYITSVYEKIGVKSRVEAVVWARERGLGL